MIRVRGSRRQIWMHYSTRRKTALDRQLTKTGCKLTSSSRPSIRSRALQTYTIWQRGRRMAKRILSNSRPLFAMSCSTTQTVYSQTTRVCSTHRDTTSRWMPRRRQITTWTEWRMSRILSRRQRITRRRRTRGNLDACWRTTPRGCIRVWRSIRWRGTRFSTVRSEGMIQRSFSGMMTQLICPLILLYLWETKHSIYLARCCHYHSIKNCR